MRSYPGRLQVVNERLRREYEAAGKGATFGALKGFLGTEGRRAGGSYEEVARVLQVGVPAVKTLIHRLRGEEPANSETEKVD